MKKTLIYIISVAVGLILGMLSYSLIRTFLPKEETKKLDYQTFIETVENIAYIEVKYGTNINKNYDYDMFINNAFKNLDLNSILYDNNECSMVNCINKLSEFTLDEKYLKEKIKEIYGPDIIYTLKDFEYYTGREKGICTYNNGDKEYTCTITHLEYENTPVLQFDFTKAVYKEDGNIETRAYVYYLEYGCSEYYDDVCIYKDPFKTDLIVKCKSNEVSDYRKYYDNVTIEFNKATDNKYYIKSLNW